MRDLLSGVGWSLCPDDSCCVNTGNRLIFGAGTSLTIEPKEVSKPTFYKLSDGDTSACLASGFSRIKAAKEQHAIFNRSTAVLTGDKLYNQLVLLTSEEEEEACEEAEDDSDVCGEPVKPDGRVNLMSVTMLGLRLLFFKTVVFNVLMTLRLWISQ
ncbi:M1-specific T cell receptor alpha chain-like isoform X2 [Pungitius pungitius]|uniref:M1-specific T cell receptor alpha chain-like isoform X2 n=1 Tax=Pungitius pungitius TaxID=134920 RepID=UPI002E0F8521